MYSGQKQIGYWRQKKDSNEFLPWPEESGRLPRESKQRVAEYLMKGKEHAAWMGFSTCRICGKLNGTTCLTDGEFVYPEGYAHYILDHNVTPDLDLLSKVLTTNNLLV